MTKALEKSIKDKVRQIAADKDWLFNDVWQIVILERWLARLAILRTKNT